MSLWDTEFKPVVEAMLKDAYNSGWKAAMLEAIEIADDNCCCDCSTGDALRRAAKKEAD